ncbi:GRCD5 protein [Artemisia annua]|uniref:GRCD5 protein n=1 Tax=Artemisia annua TaxID=35608 RepID=A0A2U1K9L4_ARTAN|nr:GRCD5 protein [Artemisia annua]
MFRAICVDYLNLLGEDLGPLNCKELESLEKQLDTSLKHIRSARTQLMLDTLSDLQKKEHSLNEANMTLKQRLIEGHQISSLHWYPQAQQEVVCYDRQHAPQHQTDEAFFHPLDCGPTLQMGYQTDPLSAGAAGPSMNNYMQAGWLPC